MRLPWIALVLLGAVGCGQPVSELSGSISNKGEPLFGVRLQFWRLDYYEEPYGWTEADGEGRFTLEPRPEGKRWAAGEYRVRVVDPGAMGRHRNTAEPPRVPAIFWNRKKSPVVVELLEGVNQMAPIDLADFPQ